MIQFVPDKTEGNQKMNLHFTFSIRQISEIRDSDQVLKIPMYFTVKWEVKIVEHNMNNSHQIIQENRLVVDESHRSWDDDSTGPKDENTEEAEVCSINNSIY